MKNFLALNASAGSGKTFALSTRFIALILSGANISEITALTFTKKAANEMKDRIIKTFLNLHTYEKRNERAFLAQMMGLSEPQIEQLRDKFLNSFLQANLKISTFDAFFGSILRQFSLNLGLSSDFSINDTLSNKQRAEFIAKIEQDMALLKSLSELIFQAENSQDSFFDNLDMLYRNFSSLNAVKGSFPSDKFVFDALLKMRNFAEQKGASESIIKTFSKNSVFEIASSSFLQRQSLNYKTYQKIYEPILDDMFFELKRNLKSYFDGLEAYKLNELDKFLQIYKKTKLELNEKLNMLSFDDVSHNVYELLCVDNTPINMLYFRLDGRINHLLIDEFQDTNVRQYEIIKPLISELVAGFGQNGLGSFFYVGDIKQSIYRFRGGKKELFDKLRDDFKQIQSENLDSNYRSHKALVKFTNAIFKDKIANFIPQNPKKTDENLKKVVNQNCDYFECESDDFGYLCVTSGDDVASVAINQVKILLQNGVNANDITILCWQNEDINTLSNLLEKEEIQSVNDGSLALLKSPFARAVVEYAKFCLFGDDIYRLNVMQILDLHDLKEIFIEPNLSASSAIAHLANALKIAHLDIVILIEQVQKFSSLSEFIFDLDSFEARAGAKSKIGVNIMTVFKSKGLEFEHVIVCDKMGRGRNNSGNFLIEYDLKSGWQIRHNAKKDSFDDDFKRLKEKVKELDKQEDMNKIYVAFTRAISSLIVVRNSDPNGNNPSFFTPYELSSGEVVEYLDLKDFSFGQIIPSEISQTNQIQEQSQIVLPSVKRQVAQATKQEQGLSFDAIYFGLAFHFLLEMIDFYDLKSLQIANMAMRNKFHKFLSENALQDVENRAKILVDNDDFIGILSGKEILKEQPVRFNDSLKQIDLLCVGEKEICIVDYKTSDLNRDENMVQVAQYKEIIGKIYSQKTVRAFLFYILKDRIYRVEL